MSPARLHAGLRPGSFSSHTAKKRRWEITPGTFASGTSDSVFPALPAEQERQAGPRKSA